VPRGTLRYSGFPEFVKVLVDIGFLNDEEQSFCKESIPWKEAAQKIISAPSSDDKDLVATICAKTTFKDDEEKTRILSGLRWLGIFSSEKVGGLALHIIFPQPC
jgi:saccharopine dehydrogenase (NADP+, L-glutamate forming)